MSHQENKAPSGAFFDELSGAELYRTQRLIVRRWLPGDLDVLARVYGDEDAMRWVGEGGALPLDQCHKWLEVTAKNYRERGYGMSTLTAPSGEVLGFMGLVHPGGQAEAELKYALARRAWGQGLASEAAEGMVQYGAEKLALTSVVASLSPENLASRRVLEKSGFRFDRLEQHEEGETLWMRWQRRETEN